MSFQTTNLQSVSGWLGRLARLDLTVFEEVRSNPSATPGAIVVVFLASVMAGVGTWLWAAQGRGGGGTLFEPLRDPVFVRRRPPPDPGGQLRRLPDVRRRHGGVRQHSGGKLRGGSEGGRFGARAAVLRSRILGQSPPITCSSAEGLPGVSAVPPNSPTAVSWACLP